MDVAGSLWRPTPQRVGPLLVVGGPLGTDPWPSPRLWATSGGPTVGLLRFFGFGEAQHSTRPLFTLRLVFCRQKLCLQFALPSVDSSLGRISLQFASRSVDTNLVSTDCSVKCKLFVFLVVSTHWLGKCRHLGVSTALEVYTTLRFKGFVAKMCLHIVSGSVNKPCVFASPPPWAARVYTSCRDL